jgi:putative two-component system response regulator
LAVVPGSDGETLDWRRLCPVFIHALDREEVKQMGKLLIKQILVIDAEMSFRAITQQFLARMGYASEIATDAPGALELLKQQPFDLVLSDIEIEDEDGVQLMRQAKEMHPDLDFIMMTGFSSKYSYSEVIRAGAADYIRKPFEMDELRAKLERIGREKNMLRDSQRIIKELRSDIDKLNTVEEGTIEAMGLTVEKRDPYMAGHQRRVSDLACAIAKEMALPADRIRGMRMAGLVHNVGKIRVPTEILSKPVPLTDIELEMIKLHPEAGRDILKTIEFPWPVADIVYQHHEKMDGSGYPQGLSAKDILQEARILTVADVVEAMASHRPYRAALGLDQSLKEISINRGVLFDANVVDACLKLFAGKR